MTSLLEIVAKTTFGLILFRHQGAAAANDANIDAKELVNKLFGPIPENVEIPLSDDLELWHEHRRLQSDDVEGIEINECSDTLALFGSNERAQSFISVIECSCDGDLSSSYTMTCLTENYCFEYDYGKACVDIAFTYDLEIDETTGRLPNSGFVNRSACTTYISGNGPGVGDSTQCKYSNPQCEVVLREEHFLYSRQAATICSNQMMCPQFFVELGYDEESAAKMCPTTFLDGVQCETGADEICGFNTPGDFDEGESYGSNVTIYTTKANCTNVAPCAMPSCIELELFDEEDPKPIRNGPVYPRCIVPTEEDNKIGSDDVALEPIDLYMQEYYWNYTSGSQADATRTCGGICGTDPESGCILQGRAHFMENHCYPLASLATGGRSGSRTMFLDGTKHCLSYYRDQHCQVEDGLFTTDRNCKEIDVLEQCDDSGTQWKVLKDHCVKSPVPVSDFLVPVVTRRVHASDEDCEASDAGDSSLFQEAHALDAPELCQTARYPLKDLSVPQQPGYVRTYCETETGEYSNEFYLDENCSDQGDDVMFTTKATIGLCNPPPNPELGLVRYARFIVTGCATDEKPQYYCKDFGDVGIGTNMPSVAQSLGQTNQDALNDALEAAGSVSVADDAENDGVVENNEGDNALESETPTIAADGDTENEDDSSEVTDIENTVASDSNFARVGREWVFACTVPFFIALSLVLM